MSAAGNTRLVRHKESDTLLVLFSGWSATGVAPFEMGKVSEGLPAHRLFLRDPANAWYQHGVPECGADVYAIARYVMTTATELGVSRLITAGNSMGGFAAMLIGEIAGAHVAVAISPQVTIARSAREEIGDHRWPDHMAALHAARGAELPTYDVAEVIRALDNGTLHRVHYSNSEDLDVRQALRLEELVRVDPHEYPAGGHMLARLLRDRGALRRELRRALLLAGCNV